MNGMWERFVTLFDLLCPRGFELGISTYFRNEILSIWYSIISNELFYIIFVGGCYHDLIEVWELWTFLYMLGWLLPLCHTCCDAFIISLWSWEIEKCGGSFLEWKWDNFYNLGHELGSKMMRHYDCDLLFGLRVHRGSLFGSISLTWSIWQVVQQLWSHHSTISLHHFIVLHWSLRINLYDDIWHYFDLMCLLYSCPAI